MMKNYLMFILGAVSLLLCIKYWFVAIPIGACCAGLGLFYSRKEAHRG